MNVESVRNDVLAERQQLLERVHENFDNIDKEKRDRFNDEVILLANGIREDMNVRIDKLESAVSETMTFEEAISAINRFHHVVVNLQNVQDRQRITVLIGVDSLVKRYVVIGLFQIPEVHQNLIFNAP